MVNQNEIKIRNFAMLFFVIGIVVAIINGAKVTSGTENLLPFFIGIGFCSVSLVFWHLSERKLQKADLEKKVQSGDNPFSYIKNAISSCSALLEKVEGKNITKEEICSEVDKINDQCITPFVDIRNTVLDLLGYGEGSEVLISIAHGERLLNRVWSYAADDYVQEVDEALKEVIASFESVLAVADKKFT